MNAEMEPEYIAAYLHDALAADGRTNELELNISIVGDKIFISGTVASDERREAVGQVAREVLPDREVHNQTTVGDYLPPEEAEHVS